MSVSDILNTKGTVVETIASSSPIAAAVAQLREKRLGALVVCDQARTIAGILSERDIIRGLAEHGDAVMKMTVADLMTTAVTTCTPADSVATVMQSMTDGRFRHQPVVVDGQLAGIISIGDVVKKRLAEMEHEADAMREYIAGV